MRIKLKLWPKIIKINKMYRRTSPKNEVMVKLRARHILVAHEYEARDILRKLGEGKAFEEMAKDYSLCGSAAQGGDLGEFGKGMMVAPFEKALLQLKPNEISGIVKTQFGYHIIKRL
jgi:peptidyl-prolyl cis-trans isomerase C